MADPTHRPEPGARPAPGAPRPGRPATALITDARSGTSAEMASRVRRYTITMAFRTACFVSMIFVEGWPRWLLLGFALFLPYIAVVAANQADQRTPRHSREPGAPEDAPQLTVGRPVDVVDGQVVEGHLGEDDRRDGRVA